ncbi:hypothetical protein EZV62_003681 [Acer yangbiense]|uniref:Malectin-like domain-containing protein n=1 Tax=Acer yangbiense TaxID=1000413 RepID=A0A5C7IJX3_9ROSI|nr:hypothetical protein EZV62_003681 [Acer yangbiense]
MACLSATANRRPTMNVVVMELNECLATEMARIKSATTGFDSKDSIDHMISLNLGTELNPRARYADDVYDRLWFPDSFGWAELSTSLPVDSVTNNGYKPPSVVMQTAGTSENASKSLDFYLEIDDTTLQFYAYLHFAEIQKLKANESREFNVSFNKVH